MSLQNEQNAVPGAASKMLEKVLDLAGAPKVAKIETSRRAEIIPEDKALLDTLYIQTLCIAATCGEKAASEWLRKRVTRRTGLALPKGARALFADVSDLARKGADVVYILNLYINAGG